MSDTKPFAPYVMVTKRAGDPIAEIRPFAWRAMERRLPELSVISVTKVGGPPRIRPVTPGKGLKRQVTPLLNLSCHSCVAAFVAVMTAPSNVGSSNDR